MVSSRTLGKGKQYLCHISVLLALSLVYSITTKTSFLLGDVSDTNFTSGYEYNTTSTFYNEAQEEEAALVMEQRPVETRNESQGLMRGKRNHNGDGDIHPSRTNVNPIAIMGGASSTVAPNTDTLTTAAITTMILLALQYCAQPPLTRKFLDSRTNKKGVTMVEEIVKIGFAAFFFINCGTDVVSSELHGWTLSSSLVLAGFPALLYATQGVLAYLGYQNTDSVTYNGLNQTKTLSAALWCFLLMGKRQSIVQMGALGILLFSALLFQGSISFSGLFQKSVESADSNVNGGTNIDKNRAHTSFSKGIFQCLAAAFISGLAGALSQNVVQMAGRSPYLYTIELSVYSCSSLLISMFATKNGRKSLSEEGGIFKHWTPLSIIPIAVRALGGVLTALVHKHAGATRKGFALILGLVMTGVTQSVVEGEPLSADQFLAMVLVILSSYLHLSYPPMAVVM